MENRAVSHENGFEVRANVSSETGPPPRPGNEEPNDPDGSAASSGKPRPREDERAPEAPFDFLLHRRTLVVAGLFALVILLFGHGSRQDSLVGVIRDLKQPVDELNAAEGTGHFLDETLDCDGRGQVDCHAGFFTAITRIPLAIVDTVGYLFGQGIVAGVLGTLPVFLLFGLIGVGLASENPGKVLLILANPFTYLWLIIGAILAVLAIKLLMIALLFAAEQVILACAILAPTVLFIYDWMKRIDGWKALTDWLHSLMQPFVNKPD